jgi:hypothetical protein
MVKESKSIFTNVNHFTKCFSISVRSLEFNPHWKQAIDGKYIDCNTGVTGFTAIAEGVDQGIADSFKDNFIRMYSSIGYTKKFVCEQV